MIVGYARVSTDDQTLALQLDALQAAGCETVFRDTISGTKTERLGLTKALEPVRSGDMLVVWRLDRLGRSLSHLIELIQPLEGRGVGFRSLTACSQLLMFILLLNEDDSETLRQSAAHAEFRCRHRRLQPHEPAGGLP